MSIAASKAVGVNGIIGHARFPSNARKVRRRINSTYDNCKAAIIP